MASCAISRIRVPFLRSRPFLLVISVCVTGVSNQDRSLLDWMALCAVCCAHVDAVFVVEAAADRVSFDDEVAHGASVRGKMLYCCAKRTSEAEER